MMAAIRWARARLNRVRLNQGRLNRDRRGVVSVEFAVAGVLMVTITMGLIGAGLLSWTRSGLQAAAHATARCVALGAPPCATPATYAVNLASQWVFPGIISAGDVTVTTATTCNGATGQYTRVTISGTHWLGSMLPAGQDTITVSITACHLSAA